MTRPEFILLGGLGNSQFYPRAKKQASIIMRMVQMGTTIHAGTTNDYKTDIVPLIPATRWTDIDDGRIIVGMGHSFGGHTLLEAMHRLPPRAFDLVVVIDPVGKAWQGGYEVAPHEYPLVWYRRHNSCGPPRLKLAGEHAPEPWVRRGGHNRMMHLPEIIEEIAGLVAKVAESKSCG